MSKCKIKGINCGFSLGDKRCVMDMPCDEIAKWLAEHDKQIRADMLNEFTRYLANNSELGNVAYLYKASYLSEQLKSQDSRE